MPTLETRPGGQALPASGWLQRVASVDRTFLLGILLGLALFIFLVVPFFSMFIVSLVGRPVDLLKPRGLVELYQFFGELISESTFKHYRLLADSYYLLAIRNSLFIGGATMIACLALALPMAYGVARTEMPGKRLVINTAMVQLAIPGIQGALAMFLLFGRRGYIAQLLAAVGLDGPLFNIYSWYGLVFILVIHLYPLVFFSSVASLRSVGQSHIDAANSLGAPNWLMNLTVVIPLAFPGIAAGMLVTFVLAFSEFAIAILLSVRGFPLLPVVAFQEMSGFGNWGRAAMFTMVILAISLAAVFIQKFVVEKRQYITITGKAYRRNLISDKWLCRGLFVFSCLVIALSALEIGAILLASVTRPGRGFEFTTLNYVNLINRGGLKSLRDTVMLCGGAAVLGTLFGTAVAYVIRRFPKAFRVLDYVSMAPFAFPGIVFGIAYIQTFNTPPFKFTGTAMILIIAYSMRRLPYVVRSTNASLQQISGTLEESSLVLGASKLLTVFRITVPLILPGIVLGAMLTFIRSSIDVAATVLLSTGEWIPASLNLYNNIAAMRYGEASAMSMLMIVLYTTVYMLFLRKSSTGEATDVA